MKTVRRHTAALNLPTLRLEGGLFLPDVLAKAAHGSARLQTEADYRLPKGLQFKDEIGRAFQIACAQWRSFAPLLERTDYDPQHAAASFITELLRDALAYPSVAASSGITLGEGTEARHYPITHWASAPGAGDAGPGLPIVVAPHTLGLDEPDARFAITGSGSRKKTAFQLAQELLNASPAHQWALVTNGKTLRLLRDAATLTRPSYLEFDLQDLLAGQRLAEFAFAWRLLHASRAGLLGGSAGQGANTDAAPPAIAWEAWREAGQEEGTRVRNGLRAGVTQALLTLGQGLVQHPANHALRQALQDGSLSPQDYFAQLLRLIYRCIFTFSVEERGLIPAQPTAEEAQVDPAAARAKAAAAQAYASGYALARLRDLALRRRARTRFDDLWQAVKIVFHGLGQGQPRLGLPALGGLFAAHQCPHLDAAQLTNADLLAAMHALRWAPTPGGGPLAPIDYRNMGTEELGSVYESLLELVPEVDLHARRFGFVGLTSEGTSIATVAGNDRKLTGSYYTPDSLVQELIRSALDPVIEQRLAQNPAQPVEALLAIRVIDPACGSGHFLLAAARRLAEKLATLRAPEGAVTPQAYRHALREVVGRCIFGVDRNPMAIELARTALWLEGFEEGRPLGFLDHHLQVGDALLGLTDLQALERGIAKDAFKPLSGDDKDVCKQLAKANAAALKQLAKDVQSGQQLLAFAAGTGLQALQALEALGADTPADVAAQERAYHQICEQLAHSPLALAADLAVGAYLLTKTPDTAAQVPTTEALHLALTAPHRLADSTHPQHSAVLAARAACQEARVLHWPLAFAQVFAAGGFDCVLGNPPWEVSQMGEEEFFATRAPEVAALQGDKRKRAIAELQEQNPALWQTFVVESQRIAAANTFYRESGRFALSAVGKLNTYPLFAETILQITAPTGRAGFIVPSGLATDDSKKYLFQALVSRNKLISFLGFDNALRVFPDVHPDTPFALVTIGDSRDAATLAHYLLTVEHLNDSRRRFALTPDEFRLINPNTLTCPVFRSSTDAELTKKLYRAAPVLIREAVWAGEGSAARLVSPEVNPWGISFSQGLFNMTSDSGLFKTEPAEDRLPLYEAKLIHQFDHRWATYTPEGDSRDLTPAEKQDPARTVTPRYWVSAREVWLRVCTLPEGLRKALKDGNPEATVLAATQLLLGWHLHDARQRNPAVGAYTAWQSFVRQHPYASEVAPTRLELCGANPAEPQPLSDHCLPGPATIKAFMSTEVQQTGWYAVDAQAEQAVLAHAARQRHLSAPAAPLQTADDVLALAEQWLQQSCPPWLMGWRDITNATNERTVIASVLPLAGVGNQMPLMIFPEFENKAIFALLLANLSSLVFDFVARHKTGGTHMNYFIFKQLPVLPPDRYTEADLAYIVPRVLELTYTAHDLAGWAHALGHDGPPFPFAPERRAHLRAELDAYYARLYGLTRDELRYILDPAAVLGDDYPSETFRVLKNKELRDLGEYRTQRLVLAAWDALPLVANAGGA